MVGKYLCKRLTEIIMEAVFLVVLLSGLAAGQFYNNHVEHFHGLTFEYHPGPHVILVRSRTECYFIRVDSNTLEQIKDTNARYDLEDKIYLQIQGHTGERQTGISTLAADLHDLRATFECLRHQVYELTLLPDATSTGSPDTTQSVTMF